MINMATWELLILYSCGLLTGIQTELSIVENGGIKVNNTAEFTSPALRELTTPVMTTAAECYHGSCTQMVSDVNTYDCSTATIKDKCVPDIDSGVCYVTVYQYTYIIIYELGCIRDCQDEEGYETNRNFTTRCCNFNLCNRNNNDLNDDPSSTSGTVNETVVSKPTVAAIPATASYFGAPVTSLMFAIVCLFVFVY